MNLRNLFLPALVSLCIAASAQAGSRAPLRVGMNPAEVSVAWGAPLEKTEQEVKRIEVWRYTEGVVIFEAGKVISAPALLPVADTTEAELQARVDPKAATTKPLHSANAASANRGAANNDVGMREVLDEVIAKYGAGDDNDSAASPNTSGAPAVIRTMPRIEQDADLNE